MPTVTTRALAASSLLVLAALGLAACGKKKPPLAPELAAVQCPAGKADHAAGAFAQARVTYLCLPKAIAEEPALLRCDLESRPMICEDAGSFAYWREEGGKAHGGYPVKAEAETRGSTLVVNFRNTPPRTPTFEEVETAWKFLHDDGARSLPAGFTLVKGPLCDRAATVLGTGICNLEAKSASLYWHVAVQVRRAPGTEITHGEYREELAFWLKHLGLLVKDPAPK